MHLYWGARRQADLYMPELPQKWAARHAWFSFIPVLSEAEADWTGRRGLVHQAVLDDHGDLSASTVYACGRSEEHTSELQSLMRISYAVFCLKKKKQDTRQMHKKESNCLPHHNNRLLH